MSSSKNITSLTADTVDNSQDYARRSWEYYKLKAFLHTSELSIILVKSLLYGFFGLMALILLSISLALYLAEAFDNVVLGYAAVGLVYLILLLAVHFSRRQLEKKLITKLSKSLLNDE